MLLLFMRNQCLFHEYMIFVLVHPTVIRGVIIQFGADRRDESAPTPTECALQITVYNQCLSSYTHCDVWLHLYNSVWTGAMNRTPTPTECALQLFMRNQCLSTYTHIYTTCTHCRGRFIVPEYHEMYGVDCPRIPMFNSRTHIVMCGCIYTIRCGRAR